MCRNFFIWSIGRERVRILYESVCCCFFLYLLRTCVDEPSSFPSSLSLKTSFASHEHSCWYIGNLCVFGYSPTQRQWQWQAVYYQYNSPTRSIFHLLHSFRLFEPAGKQNVLSFLGRLILTLVTVYQDVPWIHRWAWSNLLGSVSFLRPVVNIHNMKTLFSAGVVYKTHDEKPYPNIVIYLYLVTLFLFPMLFRQAR